MQSEIAPFRLAEAKLDDSAGAIEEKHRKMKQPALFHESDSFHELQSKAPTSTPMIRVSLPDAISSV